MKNNLFKIYIYAIIGLGLLVFSVTLYNFPFQKLDIKFFFLAAITIGLGSRISIKIPKFNSHVSVSDTFIYLALLLYGGEVAIILSAVEAFCSSWRFCNQKRTVLLNAAICAISTAILTITLHLCGIDTSEELHGDNVQQFATTLTLIILVQFFFNSGLASIYGALKSQKLLWETWKSHYLWTFITYLVGAISAGLLVKLIDYVGFIALLTAAPVVFFVYFTYRMYMKNIEISLAQAEQAENHAQILETQSSALRESEERFRSAFDYAPIGIALVSPLGRWMKVNHALCQILGYTEDEFLTMDFQSMIAPEDLGETLIKINDLIKNKYLNCQLEQRYLHKNGEVVWVLWSVSTTDSKNEQSNLIFQILNITSRKSAEEKLQHDATHDVLTGLPNRKYFMSELVDALEKMQTETFYNVSVLFIDLDRFKIVNDSLGHHIGDELLVGIADRLRDCVRPTDMVARLGGDEFTILVEGGYNPAEVITIAERIQAKFAIPFDLSGHKVYSSASIGILHASEKHLAAEDMMRDADTAMYQAKRAGKARHEVFDEDMHTEAKETLQIETELRRAIENDELTVFYQPIFSISADKIEGFEALARWNHPTLGVISPGKFIPLAEELGLIGTLGEQILRKSCSQFFPLLGEPEHESLSLSVNLSCKQFAQINLVERIRAILDETGFPIKNLKLEITESVFFEYKDNAVRMLHELRDLGIDINIDDFGTGYSNLSYLLRMPISTLKIDRSFISSFEENKINMEIVQTIMMMARNLKLKVTAEGVENKEQLSELKKLNCDSAQGFLFAHPMPFENVESFLGKTNLAGIPANVFEDVSVLATVQ